MAWIAYYTAEHDGCGHETAWHTTYSSLKIELRGHRVKPNSSISICEMGDPSEYRDGPMERDELFVDGYGWCEELDGAFPRS